MYGDSEKVLEWSRFLPVNMKRSSSQSKENPNFDPRNYLEVPYAFSIIWWPITAVDVNHSCGGHSNIIWTWCSFIEQRERSWLFRRCWPDFENPSLNKRLFLLSSSSCLVEDLHYIRNTIVGFSFCIELFVVLRHFGTSLSWKSFLSLVCIVPFDGVFCLCTYWGKPVVRYLY